MGAADAAVDIELSTTPTSNVIGKPTSKGLSPSAQPSGVEVRSATPDTKHKPQSKMNRAKAAKDKAARRWTMLKRCFNISIKALIAGVLLAAMTAAFFDFRYVEDSQVRRSWLLTIVFTIGLASVAFEDFLGVDKAAMMLLCAGVMWTILAVSDHPDESEKGRKKLNRQLEAGVAEVGKLLLFLLPAMGLCETIDHFNGFAVAAHAMKWLMNGKKVRLLPIISLFTFVLCIVVDSMSAMLVSLKTLRRLEPTDHEWRRRCGGLAVIGANACVFSPVGEVTTAMLWIAAKITPAKIVGRLMFPSLLSLAVPLCFTWCLAMRRQRRLDERVSDNDGYNNTERGKSRGERHKVATEDIEDDEHVWLHSDAGSALDNERLTLANCSVFCLGVFSVLTVPVLKTHTDLPPYFGMMFALGLMWFVTDVLGVRPPGSASPDGSSAVLAALHKVDLGGLLFFAGVLQSIAALDSASILREFAQYLKLVVGDSPIAISIALGLSSALVDNVPLVQAAIDMFPATETDAPLWQLVALCAGTGGSLLATGGIAGVTLMSVEGVSFFWYFKNISFWALVGFFSGIGGYELQRILMG